MIKRKGSQLFKNQGDATLDVGLKQKENKVFVIAIMRAGDVFGDNMSGMTCVETTPGYETETARTPTQLLLGKAIANF